MAVKIGAMRSVEENGYLSDESDFYGDEVAKHELEEKASTFDVAEWWKCKIPTLMEIAEKNMKTDIVKESVKLYNPYEGRGEARQLSETVDDFLARLPPATTPFSSTIPWIFIANPYRKAPQRKDHDDYSRTGEGPPDERSEWGAFTVTGNRLLQELTQIRHTLEKKKPGKTKAAITREVNADKDRIVKEILDTAKNLHCTTGKWMLFCDEAEVNAVWSVVARATADNDLGIAAKVAPDDGQNRKPRLMCIYTKDFTDMKDVSRVLHKMKDLGLVNNREKPIYYKCDAYTYLELTSANPYNIKASLYSSKDILQAKTEKQLDSFFYKKKKKDEGDWRPLEWE
ncbi:DUF1917-domain-containing protein [Mollisia scopiformis]|uniref:DUF1917-domain-containing protein n=1 Tax=Mollisia scopiformis TaxID=149040 RepID=A0A194X3T7_MOLSC|nr:DUF1917-domain-containing protein [Mollisia scopiformis]KUJ14853.1 DUF1917-domain-containing protein [Mollisia scopiformis]